MPRPRLRKQLQHPYTSARASHCGCYAGRALLAVAFALWSGVAVARRLAMLHAAGGQHALPCVNWQPKVGCLAGRVWCA